MKVKVPAKIQIGGHLFMVQRIRGLVASNDAEALSNNKLLIIRLEDSRPQSVMTQSFLHELCHVGTRIFRDDYANEKLSDEEHRIHDALGELLTQVLPQLGVELDFSAVPVGDVS